MINKNTFLEKTINSNPNNLYTNEYLEQSIRKGSEVPQRYLLNFSLKSHDIINKIIDGKDNIKYLEIGVDEGHTFDNVQATLKHGVDPYGGSQNITHRMSSQEFFTFNKYFWKNTYDVIFIDALHLADIILKEVEECLSILNPGGVILFHDVVPVKESAQIICERDYNNFLKEKINLQENKSFNEYCNQYGWVGYNGDCWKVMAHLRSNTNYFISSFPEACIGILSLTYNKDEQFSKPENPENEIYDWDYYLKNIDSILNPVISFEELSDILSLTDTHK